MALKTQKTLIFRERQRHSAIFRCKIPALLEIPALVNVTVTVGTVSIHEYSNDSKYLLRRQD